MSITHTSWKKGRSGNPKGAPKKGWSWKAILTEALEEKTKEGISNKEAIAKAVVREALKGNIQAIREIMNRMDGLPKAVQEVSEPTGGLIIYKPEKRPEGYVPEN